MIVFQIFLPTLSMIDVVDIELTRRNEINLLMKSNLVKAQAHMKEIIDKKRVGVTFVMGDWVMLKVFPF